MDRAATFRSFIARKPDDPFPRYGLAMELRARGDRPGAIAEFATLIERFPDYVPAYLLAGTTLADDGQLGAAADVLRRGLAAADRQGDSHAARELASALAEVEERARQA